MGSQNYQSLSELKPLTKSDRKIKVQISRKWNDYCRYPGCTPGLNVIVVDENVRPQFFIV